MRALALVLMLTACTGDDSMSMPDPHATVACDPSWANAPGGMPTKCDAACRVPMTTDEGCVDAADKFMPNAFQVGGGAAGTCTRDQSGRAVLTDCATGTVGACFTMATIQDNHGHVWPGNAVIVPGRTEAFHIMGAATHDHVVTVTPDLFDQIHDSGSAAITSSSDGTHTHVVVVSCR